MACNGLVAYGDDFDTMESVEHIQFDDFSENEEYPFVENMKPVTLEEFAIAVKHIYKGNYPGNDETIDSIVDSITESDVFITLFEEEGKLAFRIVEDSLKNALNSTAVPIDQTDELYFSKYNFSPVKQYSSDKNAAVATVMALMGSGISGYSSESQNKINTTLNSDTSTQITIQKITSF